MVEKLVTNLHDKNRYFIYMQNLKQASNKELALKNRHKVIKSI